MGFASATEYEQWLSSVHCTLLKAFSGFALDCPQAIKCLKTCQCDNRLTGIEILALMYCHTTEVSLACHRHMIWAHLLHPSPIKARSKQRKRSFVAIVASS